MPAAQSSNTIVNLGDRVFIKGYRRLQPGINTEVEIGRFLTAAGFAHGVPIAGSVEYVGDDGRQATLAVIQAYVAHQGDGWTYTLDYLDRFFDSLPSAVEPPAGAADLHGPYLELARTLGTRTAELHATLARRTGDAAFDPEPVTPADVAAWTRHVHEHATATLDHLAQRRDALPENARSDADGLLAGREALLARIRAHASDRITGAKTRLHGDYHLGQVLIARNDFVITDFEGEPARSLAERRAKISPLKDVAGMLRSFDYAMHAALFDVLTKRPDAHALHVDAARDWQRQAADAFIDGYDAVARAEGLASARDEAAGLVELFVLEKALYELAYELDNRPDWVRIPLRSLAEVSGPGR
jgi:maltose alpha-D-glucosyltransferase/alpha-amylase